MSFQKILVPVDGNGVANDALNEAFAMAKLSGGHVTALHVTNQQDADASRTEATVGAMKRAKDAGVEMDAVIKGGSPSDVILAESKNYDVIIMGTAKKKKILAESVAREVIKSSECPVIVVRSKR